MITIVGAGLVGSLLAVLLKQKGFDVEVFERRSDPRSASAAAGRSINLVVTSRGLRTLEIAGLNERIYDFAVPVYGRMMHSPLGETAYQPYGQANEFNLSISRDSLNRFLISEAEAAGVRFHFERDLTSLDPTQKKAQFNNSYVTDYELLFGADGAGSRVRKQLTQHFPNEIHDQTDWLEADYKELTLPFGPSGEAQLKTDALHIWPRGDHMMMALANKDGSFTMTLYLPKKSFEELKTPEAIRNLFEREFKDAIPLMPHYVEEFLSHPQGTLGTVRCDKWIADGNIALIGDAAHAIVPFFGQGMNCGFEDCTVLIELIEKSKPVELTQEETSSSSPPISPLRGRFKSLNWSQVLADYQIARKPNANAIADMALENWIEMRDKVADQKFLLRKKVESALEQKHPHIYKSRYGLITYTLAPYLLAQKAGLIQDELMAELLAGIDRLEDVSWKKAEALLSTKWLPFVESHHLKIEKYPK